jgi:hypothetical protein
MTHVFLSSEPKTAEGVYRSHGRLSSDDGAAPWTGDDRAFALDDAEAA